MAKSSSPFHNVLRVKRHQEKVAQQQLMHIEDAHNKEKELLNTLHKVRTEAVGGTQRSGRARVNELQTQRAFIIKLTKQINHQASKLDDIKRKANAKRKELTERAQSRQMVEKLDEKRKVQVSKNRDRVEQEMIDEVANRTARRV
jgi:flagellar export protein FliJ